MKRVYIAGAYSADNIIDVLNNIRKGMRAGTKALLSGVAPFVPWHDFHFQLMLQEGETLKKTDYYKYSLTWLEVCEEMWVLPGWEKSEGTIEEIRVAKELNISIKYLKNG